LSFFVSSTRSAQERPLMRIQRWRGFPAAGPDGAGRRLEDALCGASGIPLGIKIYYILCSSTESTLIIVAWVRRRKRFLMHKSGVPKALKNQRATFRFAIAAPSVHRFSTMLCTARRFMEDAERANEFAGTKSGNDRRPVSEARWFFVGPDLSGRGVTQQGGCE
jgi:hypothetical protein